MKLTLCKTCGVTGKSKKKRRGSHVLFLLLSLFGMLPGLIYWYGWRKPYRACRSCGSEMLIPSDSPEAIKLINK